MAYFNVGNMYLMIYEELAGNNEECLLLQAENIFCLQNCQIKMRKKENDEWSLLRHGFEGFFQL